jgi:protein-disulfide isomerase
MNQISRRTLLAATALAALGLPASAQQDVTDLAALHAAPENGEMAMGPETAKVTVVEYASATCPHCADFHKNTFPALKSEYIDTGKIRFIFREFPLNDAALAGFMLARCAPKEKYFPILDVVFSTLNEWTKDPLNGLKGISQQAGLTAEQFDACMKNETVAKQILATRGVGEKFGVAGTPTFFVNGKVLNGETSIEEFRKVIDPLLG